MQFLGETFIRAVRSVEEAIVDLGEAGGGVPGSKPVRMGSWKAHLETVKHTASDKPRTRWEACYIQEREERSRLHNLNTRPIT